jgi:vancomycin resistance protein YoaR
MSKKRLLISILAGGLIGLTMALAVVFVKFNVHGKLPDGTQVAGIDLSMQTKQEAKQTLGDEKEKFNSAEIKLSFLSKEASFTPEELGLAVLDTESIDSLQEVDARKASVLDLFGATMPIEKEGKLITSISKDKLSYTLEKEFNLKALEPKSASFYFDETGGLEIQEGKKGLAIDYDALAKELKVSAERLQAPDISLASYRVEPEVKEENLLEHQEEIVEKLGRKLVLVDPIYSDDWYLKLEDHLDWVKLTEKEKVLLPYIGVPAYINKTGDEISGEASIHIEIDQDKLNKYVDEEISEWLDRDPEDVNIYTDENGEVVVEGKGSNGRKVQRQLLRESIELALENEINEITIPVLDLSPEINISADLQELGITERIAVGHTSYYGSPANRVHNIKEGASKFNGKLIAPGEVFSFNQNLGAVDGSTGYRKELVIKKEGTIPEYGGGICQVSTTFYRAVLFSGLPIVERNQHSYAVSYYSQVLGHGLDATIYLGGPDFKFQNDTDSHLLIQTYTDSDYELNVVLYGEPKTREVELEGPYLSGYHSPGPTVYEDTTTLLEGQTKQMEKAHTGFTAVWYRHIFNEDGEEEIETISTNYRAIPAKILVGVPTDTEG